MYGDVNQIGGGRLVLIVVQLTIASMITILLDDMMTKGYGVGNSGTSLFIAINIAETVLWKTFSPLSYKIGDSYQYEGAFVSLILGTIFGPEQTSDHSRCLLQVRPAQYPQRPRNSNHLPGCDLLPRIQGQPTLVKHQECPRRILPNQALLHKQHAHHFAGCPRVQSLLLVPDAP